MLTIWGRTSSINVQKVMWAVAELGLPHERIDAGGKFGGLDTDEFGGMNPNRRVPVIRDGDFVLWESNVVVRYLAAKHGSGSLWPADPAERARSEIWMDWTINHLMPDLGICFWHLVRHTPEQRDMNLVERSAAQLARLWPILDRQLADRNFVGGTDLTIGDIPPGTAYWRYSNLAIERPPLPNLDRWFEALKTRSAYRAEVMHPVV